MTKKQFGILKKLLIERQQEILKELGDSDDDIDKLQRENAADWVDRVNLDDAVNSLMAKESGLAAEIEEIIEALENIDKDGYGTCNECGQDIAFERLEAVPTAKYCVACKNEKEKSQIRTFIQRGPTSIPSELFEFDE